MDDVVNYKSSTFVEDLVKATPDKIDLFFDNVGVTVLDEVMNRMNPHGILCAVGAISLYNKIDQSISIKNYVKLIADRLSIIGFMLYEYRDHLAEADEALSSAAATGKISVEGAETVVDIRGRLEEIPHVWTGLFTGANTGKLITKVAE